VDIGYLKGRIEEVRRTIGELSRLASRPYAEMGLDEKYSMRYQLVVLVEAMGDIGMHIAIEDLGSEPRSYAECFKLLEAGGLIGSAEDLVKMVRLRNLLVHRYWIIDDARVYRAVKEDFEHLLEFVKKVEEKYGTR